MRHGGGAAHIKTRTEVLEILRSLKDELKGQYHVDRIALFDSNAREEQGESSDIDVLVGFGLDEGLFNFLGCRSFLRKTRVSYGCLASRMDAVPETALRPEIRGQVIQDPLIA